jgi:hypothetical protein
MAVINYVDVNEFLANLKGSLASIVSVKEFEAGKEIRKKLMKRKALSLSEIVEHPWFP